MFPASVLRVCVYTLLLLLDDNSLLPVFGEIIAMVFGTRKIEDV